MTFLKNHKYLDLFKNKFVFFYILRFIFSFKHLKKKYRKWFFFYRLLKITFLIWSTKNQNENTFFQPDFNKHYLIKFYNVINRKFFSNDLNMNYFNYTNTYFFWYFFNKDPLIKLLINLIMKNGKKYASYKIIYQSLFFIKKLIGIQPFFILKKSLYQNRFLFDIQYLHLKKKIITMPKLLPIKSQLSKSIKYIFNNFILSTFQLSKKKKYLAFYKKISYLILNHLLYKNRLKQIINKEKYTIKNNFFHIKKETFLSKYLNDMDNSKLLKKVSFFRIKFKSLSKKDKIFKEKIKPFFEVKKQVNFMKLFLFNRYKLHLQSKTKLKSKWF